MRESRSYGSVRGVLREKHPYRDLLLLRQRRPNCAINTGVIRLELLDEVQLVRNPSLGRKLIVPIWETSVDPVDDRQALLDAFTSMTERFCLSYLSANR